MSQPTTLHAQRGVTLIISLLMMLLITLLAATGFTLSTSNLTSVGNMQFRDEAISAANSAADEVLGSLLGSGSMTMPPARTLTVDINNDGTDDYTVAIAAPTCIRASIATPGTPSSVTLPTMSPSNTWNSVWDVDATVTNATGDVSVRVRSGMRVLLTQVQKDAVCP